MVKRLTYFAIGVLFGFSAIALAQTVGFLYAPSGLNVFSWTNSAYTFGNATDQPTYTFAGSNTFTVPSVSTNGVVQSNSGNGISGYQYSLLGTGGAGPTNGMYQVATNAITWRTNSTAAGNLDATQHWRLGATGSPTITSGTCGTSTNGTLSAASNDHAGEVIIGAATTTACPVIFSAAYTTAPRAVIITPGNAAAIGATVLPYVSSVSASGFTITGTVLASTSFYYWVQ
jgi:hypothetical protein